MNQRTSLTGLENAPPPDYARPKNFTHKLNEAELQALRKYAAGLLPDKEGRMLLKSLIDRMWRDITARGFFVCASIENGAIPMKNPRTVLDGAVMGLSRG